MVSKALLLPVIFGVGRAHIEKVTPVGKVIQLLTELQHECESEAQEAAAKYGSFADFCKVKTTAYSGRITSGRDAIDSLSASIAEDTATRKDKQGKLQDTKANKERLTIELTETKARCAKEREKYEADNLDRQKAIESLNNAITSMNDAKPASAAAGLVSVRRTVQRSPAFTEAMKQLDSYKQWNSFMQVDPSDPEYKHHSAGIIEVLNNLLTAFETKKSDSDDEEEKRSTACSDKKTALGTSIETDKNSITTLEGEIDGLTSEIAKERSDLEEEDATLKDDKLYLTDLTKLCETRANEFDQQSQMRADELSALEKAMKLLQNDVKDAEKANKRAEKRVEDAEEANEQADTPTNFLQVEKGFASKHSSELHDQRIGSEKAVEMPQRQDAVLRMLSEEGHKLKSTILLSFVARAGSDPFEKVKGLIQKLIERLIEESTNEATKKGNCDTEMATAEQQRDYRYTESNKLGAEIGELESKKDDLEREIKELEEKLDELAKDAAKAKELREEERVSNLAQIKEAKGGLQAVTKAMGILKDFYKSSAKAKVFLQSATSPIDEDADNPGAASGAYKGKQGASKGIIGLLEVIKSDFEHTVKTVTAEEKKAAADFVEFDRENKASTQGATTKKQLDEEDLESTKSSLETTYSDLQKNTDLLDAALDELKVLRPRCVDTGMSYEERKTQREEEITALEKALCQLGDASAC